MTGLADLPARVQAKIRVDDAGCWIWTASRTSNGYGKGHFPGIVTQRAHRGVYILLRGPVPADLVCDHLCRVTLCVNPDHIEVVPQVVNVRRGKRALLQYVTHCSVGHEMRGDNLSVRSRPDGRVRRDCRECMRLSRLRTATRKLQAAA